jgi:hypothetical protein
MANTKRLFGLVALVLLLLVTFAAGWIVAKTGMGSAMDPATLPELERQFTEQMRGAAMVGSFTIAGREDRPARPDRYDIASVEKVGEDRWRFNARIGEKNVTLPVTVTMRWVDDTPMIMLTDMTIPAMGTFSARVFFHGDRYAGTWQHDRVGGHMYGRIERSEANR